MHRLEKLLVFLLPVFLVFMLKLFYGVVIFNQTLASASVSKFAGLNVENYLRHSIIENVMADLDIVNPFMSGDELKEKYGLDKIEDYIASSL